MLEENAVKGKETELEQFSFQMKSFMSIGFYREGLEKYRKLFLFIHFVAISFVIFASYAELAFIVTSLEDIFVAAECFAPIATEIIVFSKIVSYAVQEKKFYALMDQVKALAETNSDSEVVKRAKRFEKAASLVYLVSANISGGLIVATPIMSNLIGYWFFGIEQTHELPYKILLTYPTNVSPNYEITYFMLAIATHVTVIQCAAFDSLFFGFCLHICAQFEVLRESFDGDIKKFSEKHEAILRTANSVKELFTPAIIVQFLMSSTLLCVLGFQLIMQKVLVKRIIASSFGMSIIIQFFVYCYGGQIMVDKSSEVADLLYEIDKDLVIVIARAQRPAKIKIGFFDASLPTFSAVLSSTGSLITMLLSFLD